MPYDVIQTLLDPLWPKGIHAYFKATNLARLDDELIDRLCAVHLAAPGPQCEIHVHQMGGAVGARPRRRDGVRRAVDAVRAQCGHRLARPAGRGDAHATGRVRWSRPRRTPRPVAHTSTSSATPDAARSAYGEETYARLVALKNAYDPTNVFRLNQNIEPDA